MFKVLWVKDLRINHSYGYTDEEKLSFELIVNKTRYRPKSIIQFTCESEASWKQWIEDIENTLLAYHRQTDFSKQIGWFHEIIQGNIYSAAYLGDIALLRKHSKHFMDYTPIADIKRRSNSFAAAKALPTIDTPDKTGMTALHWAVFRGHELCVRLLIDRSADIDAYQKGLNTPLLLAAAAGHETIARLLIEHGADIHWKNHRGHDAVFMAVLYGHSSKGLPWLLQLFNAKGLDLNEIDSAGATALHLCAEKNLARPVRMLVDSGADVNSKHGKTQLTPLQMACIHLHPDVETIRSFLDKGGYPNWKDVQGRTAFDMVLKSGYEINNRVKTTNNQVSSSPIVFHSTTTPEIDVNSVYNQPKISTDDTNDRSSDHTSNDKWRAMEDTLHLVGDWAVRALPVLLELSKKGARFEPKDIEFLRSSFKTAVLEAKDVWEKKSIPDNFIEFVHAREQNGEDLQLHRNVWNKNNTSPVCELCSDSFGITNRRHHCRGCGILCCDRCSTKRLPLTMSKEIASRASLTPQPPSSSIGANGSHPGTPSVSTTGPPTALTPNKKAKVEDKSDQRVCDGCYNRLCHEAAQPSPDHFRVKQLKQCAVDLISCIEELIDSLDDPEGDSYGFKSSIRETMNLTKELDNINISGTPSSPSKGSVSRYNSWNSGKFSSFSVPSTPKSPAEALIDVLKLRENRLFRTEDTVAKFLEVIFCSFIFIVYFD